MRPLSSFVIAILLAAASGGCGSSSTSPTSVGSSYLLFGKLPAAIAGVPQTSAQTFQMSAAATVTLTLTSAVETMLDGTALSTINVGVGLGTVTNGVCTVLPGAFVNTVAGTAAQMAWPMPAGSDCLQISDVTTLEGPVAYTVKLTY
jgi:hypothetical protein